MTKEVFFRLPGIAHLQITDSTFLQFVIQYGPFIVAPHEKQSRGLGKNTLRLVLAL